MAEPLLRIEVAYATPARQVIRVLEVERGTTLRQAVMLTDLAVVFPEIELGTAPLGIYGRMVKDAETKHVDDGQRIEVYRPLVADPKEARKQRAARAAEARADKPR
ncbi:RnfH family protein [Pseudomonas sp. Marseille-QA0892]